MSVLPSHEKLSNGSAPSATHMDLPDLLKTEEACRRNALVCSWRCGPDGRLMMIWSVASALDATPRPLIPAVPDAHGVDERAELFRTYGPLNEAA